MNDVRWDDDADSCTGSFAKILMSRKRYLFVCFFVNINTICFSCYWFFTNPYCCSCCCCFSLHSTRFSGVVYVLGWEGEKASEYLYSNVCLLGINPTSQPNHTPKINRKNNNPTVQQQKLNKWKLQQNNAWTNALPWNTIVMTNNCYNNNCHKKGTFGFFL